MSMPPPVPGPETSNRMRRRSKAMQAVWQVLKVTFYFNNLSHFSQCYFLTFTQVTFFRKYFYFYSSIYLLCFEQVCLLGDADAYTSSTSFISTFCSCFFTTVSRCGSSNRSLENSRVPCTYFIFRSRTLNTWDAYYCGWFFRSVMCQSVTDFLPAKTAERIEVLLGVNRDFWSTALDESPDPHTGIRRSQMAPLS